jgi:hypothetical protein
MHNSSITWEDQWNRVKRLSDWVDADIANGAKHFSLERYRIVQDAKVTAKSVNIGQKAASLRFSGPVPCHDEAITSGGATYGFRFGAYDSRELKNKCMREWVNFLKSKKLI